MQGEVVQFSKDSIIGESDVNTDVLGPKVHGSSPCHHALSKENPRGTNPSLLLCIKPPQQYEIILTKRLPSHQIHTPYLCQKDSPGLKATLTTSSHPPVTMSFEEGHIFGVFLQRVLLGAFMNINSIDPERQV